MQKDDDGHSESADGHGLRSNYIDHFTATMKGLLGAVPGVGSLLAEFAGAVVPNQRLDRVTKFVAQLHERVSEAESKQLELALQSPGFGDFAEESIRQAAQSLTDERRAYLAAAVHRALGAGEVEISNSRQLLRLLGEVSDLHVVILRSHLVETSGGGGTFRDLHASALDPVAAHLGSSQDEIDRATMWSAQREYLERLGLLQRRLKIDPKTKQPVIDAQRGSFQMTDHRLTDLGRVLLKFIGLTSDGFNPAGVSEP